MNVEAVALDSLKADPANPRLHDARNLDAICASLEHHGQVEPLVIQQSTRMVIAGNGRMTAMKRLGWSECDAVLLDVSDDEARALSIRLNRTGELATWDDDVLAKHLAELAEMPSVDLDSFGFDDDELGDLMQSLDELQQDEATDDVDDDALDALPDTVEPRTIDGERIDIDKHVLHCGDCIETMRQMADNSIDAIVTDPPYGIGFLNRQWDCAVPGDEFAEQALRVLKPGGHIIAFAATRTVHRLATALEDASFELRDMIAWQYWQGFPKSMSVEDATSDSKWRGYGTGIKPSFEPAVLARKPLDGTVAANVQRYGTGALNIDACRYAFGDDAWPGPQDNEHLIGETLVTSRPKSARTIGLPATSMPFFHSSGRFPANVYACAKPSRSEREQGCDELPAISGAQAVDRKANSAGVNNPRAGAGRTAAEVRNIHPTVKPIRLMRWLCRLVGGQPDSVVLDPFCGSGTTMIAAHVEGFRCIGIEREPQYCDIIRARVEQITKETA